MQDLVILRTSAVSASGQVLYDHYNGAGITWLAALLALGVWSLTSLMKAIGIFNFARKPHSAKVEAFLTGQLSDVLKVVRSHMSGTESFAASLASAQERLAALSVPKQANVVVTLLSQENQRMRRETSLLQKSLENTQSEIERLRAELASSNELALRDALTTLGNRQFFDETLDRALHEAKRCGQPLSLIMCDVDHFKQINDKYGHAVGDEILRIVGLTLSSGVRQRDATARIGGEEFAIILPDTALHVAAETAERLRSTLFSKTFTIRATGQQISRISASFGVVQRNSDEDASRLVRRADNLMYRAKNAGRNTVCWKPEN